MNPLFPVVSGLWSSCLDVDWRDRVPAGGCPVLGHVWIRGVLGADRLPAPRRPHQCAHPLPSATMEHTGMFQSPRHASSGSIINYHYNVLK